MAAFDLTDDIVVRWEAADPAHIPVLQEGGITAIVTEEPTAGFVERCAEAGIAVEPASNLRITLLEAIAHAPSDAPLVLNHGLWPGSGRPPNTRGDYAVAGASAKPWVDANMHWVAWLSTLYPERTAVLGYLPDEQAGLPADRLVPYETLELALVEARVNGGNFILALEPRYRNALLGGEPRAMAAWNHLGRTARWLRQNAPLFRQPTVPNVTVLVEAGEETAEIANLLFRQNASPMLAPLAFPPAPDPPGMRAMVAVNLGSGVPSSRGRILAHARAGSTVVLDDGDQADWWRDSVGERFVKEHDRDFFRLGKGRLVVYKERIVDPSDFALDVIDLVTHPRRAARLWGANTVIAVAKSASADDGANCSLVLVNYGSQSYSDILARVQGAYTRASLLRPESEPIELKTAARGTTTEVLVPEIRKAAIVLFR
jgi:hypothetical protein